MYSDDFAQSWKLSTGSSTAFRSGVRVLSPLTALRVGGARANLPSKKKAMPIVGPDRTPIDTPGTKLIFAGACSDYTSWAHAANSGATGRVIFHS